MTTAHRPTWKPAMGGSQQGGNVIIVPTRTYSSRDLPGYLTLKERKLGQGRKEELQYKDFKKELLEKEKNYFLKQNSGKDAKDLIDYSDEDEEMDQQQTKNQISEEPALQKKVKRNNEEEQNKQQQQQQQQSIKKKIIDDSNINPYPQDADDEEFIKSDSSSSSEDESKEENSSDQKKEKKNKPDKNQDKQNKQQSSSYSSSSDDDSDDSDENDNEILMKEFEQLKKQKEEEEKLKVRQKDDKINMYKNQEILKGNPLLVGADTYSLQKKWYEDTVFKNQARFEIKEKKRFINDNVRSDFHKKFMSKYLQV